MKVLHSVNYNYFYQEYIRRGECLITLYSLLHVCVEYSCSFQANSKIYYLPSLHIASSMASFVTVIILGVVDVQKWCLLVAIPFYYQYHVLFMKFSGFSVVQCVLGKEDCLLGSRRQLSY